MTLKTAYPVDIKHAVWMWLGRHEPGLLALRLYAKGTRRDVSIVDRHTDLVVEGFPRSANTTTVAALRVAHNEALRIAHHVHGFAQVLVGVKLRIPVLILIREPAHAVASLVVRAPSISVDQALKNYQSFYAEVLKYQEHVVVADFREVTEHFDDVVRRLNGRFGSQFRTLGCSPLGDPRVLRLVEQMDRRDRCAKEVNEATVSRPSYVRSQMNRTVIERLNRPEYSKQLASALRVYEEILNSPAAKHGKASDCSETGTSLTW